MYKEINRTYPSPSVRIPWLSSLNPAQVKKDQGEDASGKDPTSFPHLEFTFLDPKNIRDRNRKKPDEDGYDPTTLYVPESFLKDQTVSLANRTKPGQSFQL